MLMHTLALHTKPISFNINLCTGLTTMTTPNADQ